MANEVELRLRRRTLEERLQRASTFVANFSSVRDHHQIPFRAAQLETLATEFDTIQQLIENMSNTEDLVAECEKRASIEESIFVLRARLTAMLQAEFASPAPNNSIAFSGIALPPITLPEFDGNEMQWASFRDTFEALIHNNSEIMEIQKFHYLRASLKGDAAKLLQSIPLRTSNYQIAWKALVDRYANDYLHKKRHLQAMLSVHIVSKETNASLHKLVDEFDRHVKMLHQLGEPTDQWSTILEYLLCTKLPEQTLHTWEDHASTLESPDYNTLIEFLQRKMRILESMSMNHPTQRESTHPNAERRPTSHLLSCSLTASSLKRCTYCQHQHALRNCYKFHRLPLSGRLQIVSGKKVCNNCLKPGHFARNCPSATSCKHCGERHHSLLHRSSNADRFCSSVIPTVATAESPGTVQQTDSELYHPKILSGSYHTTTAEQVFLPTIRLQIMDVYGKAHTVRALLDSASQPNLITAKLAHLLQLRPLSEDAKVEAAGGTVRSIRESVFAEIRSRKGTYSNDMKFLIMETLTSNLPSQSLSVSKWNIPEELPLADPDFNKSRPIDLIIGAKHYQSFFPTSGRLHLSEESPVLIDSVFGWIVTGSAIANQPQPLSVPYVSAAVCMRSLQKSRKQISQSDIVQKKGILSYTALSEQTQAHAYKQHSSKFSNVVQLCNQMKSV